MLPKVANVLLHQTARAAAAAPSQTGHTLRSVLQSSGSSSSISAWSTVGSSSYGGSAGAGAGGAKYHAGSRAYSGYTGAGRAVTQANASGSDAGLADDTDERTAQRVAFRSVGKSARGRGSGIILRAGRPGLLNTVQEHIRSKHTFADKARPTTTEPSETSATGQRSNSSLARSEVELKETVIPPVYIPTSPGAPRQRNSEIQPVLAARDAGDYAGVVAAVLNFRTNHTSRFVDDWNTCLQTLYQLRSSGEPLSVLLDTYNDMISRSLAPTMKTYQTLIQALCDRDVEVNKVITALTLRMKRQGLAGRVESAHESIDEERVKKLQEENNFGSAMSIFQAATVLYGPRIPLVLYSTLLRSCALHANVDAAIHVYAHMEGRAGVRPAAVIYSHLIDCYSNAGDLQGAKEIFAEFRHASAADRVEWTSHQHEMHAALGDSKRSGSARAAQIIIWNKMIESYFRCGEPAGALGLLEQMMDSQAGETFGAADTPPPASSTFSNVVTGFCESGDVATALAWFDRLLQQDSSAAHPFAATSVPHRPDAVMWHIMLDHLSREGMINDFNRLFRTLIGISGKDGIRIRGIEHLLLARTNIQYLKTGKNIGSERALELIDFVADRLYGSGLERTPALQPEDSRAVAEDLVRLLIRHKRRDKAVEFIQKWAQTDAKQIASMEPNVAQSHLELQLFWPTVSRVALWVLQPSADVAGPLDFATFLPLADVCDAVGAPVKGAFAALYLQLFADAVANGTLPKLTPKQWRHLVVVSAQLGEDVRDTPTSVTRPANYSYQGTISIVQSMVSAGVNPAELDNALMSRMGKAIGLEEEGKDVRSDLEKLGSEWSRVINAFDSAKKVKGAKDKAAAKAPEEPPIRVDIYHSRFVDEYFPAHKTITPLMCYDRFEVGAKQGVYPTPEAIGRLINILGRQRRVDLVRNLYQAGQRVITHIAADQQWQSAGWFQLEDNMIIALAHASDYDAACTHRTRIIEQGGMPSADAYGALISAVKDTTDDASNGLKLFNEAQQSGVAPNVYLYNTIISKLAKARKVDFALELFQQMKTVHLQPTPVTYGAVIAACARVGDAHSAEILFTEMASQPNFRPRVPPYNTMMQLYATTKPDRERILTYYNMLLATGVPPSAHTYKLLMDAYGTIQPIDLPAMERVFEQLTHDHGAEVNGTHWASLINAYGCVAKDLDAAIRVFESVANHPSSAKAKDAQPDALTYEAMINVLVTLRRTDLVPQYTQRLLSSKVHMTAYIANFLIKGHAAAGDMDAARKVFESLLDPPSGVAAPNNHPSHEAAKWVAVPRDAPVYREPSTWEAIFRAELGSNNRENALALLERLKSRHYPKAVYNRIAGIMLSDQSVSPWSSSDESSPSPP